MEENWIGSSFVKVCWCSLPKIIKISLHVETTACQIGRIFIETRCRCEENLQGGPQMLTRDLMAVANLVVGFN